MNNDSEMIINKNTEIQKNDQEGKWNMRLWQFFSFALLWIEEAVALASLLLTIHLLLKNGINLEAETNRFSNSNSTVYIVCGLVLSVATLISLFWFSRPKRRDNRRENAMIVMAFIVGLSIVGFWLLVDYIVYYMFTPLNLMLLFVFGLLILPNMFFWRYACSQRELQGFVRSFELSLGLSAFCLAIPAALAIIL